MKELLLFVRIAMALWQFCQSSLRSRSRMRALTAVAIALVVLVALEGSVSARKRLRPRQRKQQLTVAPGEKKLALVHTVFRHGQRTPADTYPNDPYINDTFSPFGWGQLTNLGRKNLYEAGQWLRKRYDSFLGPLYTVDSTWAQSTDADRARMSCALVLAGLWPPAGTELDWNPGYNWQPAPIHAQDLADDTLLLARKDCPRYFEELENVHNLPEIKEILEKNEELFDELSVHIGRKVKNLDDVQDVYSTLKAEEEYGKEIPAWTKDYYPDRLYQLTAESFTVNAYNDELKRLKGGPLLKKLIEDWKAKATGNIKPSGRKIFVYAGHDSTVANLLGAIKVWDTQIPNYGIMAIFELYQDTATNKYSVELFLRNSTTVDPYPLTIPGCDIPCPLEKVIKLTKDLVPRDWAQECRAKDKNYVAPAPGGP